MSRNRTVALVEGLAAVAIWGVSFIATKIALREIAPVTLVWLRFAMGVAVLAVAAAHRREIAALPPRDVVVLGLLGLQGISFHQWLQSTALVTSQAATSGWIVASAPVFIAAFAWLLLRERLPDSSDLRQKLTGAGKAVLGILLQATGDDSVQLRNRLYCRTGVCLLGTDR